MNKASWFHASAAACAMMVLCLSATLSYGAVTADPAIATFTSSQQSVVIKLMNDGAPIPAKDIRGWQLLASGHDYKHMLNVEKMDGALKIALSKSVDTGSYDLNIETAEGAVIVQVFIPLSDVPDIVEKTAALTGLSEKKVKEKLGLTTTTGREEVLINLPAVYYEGQTLELSMPVNAGRACTWFMNGDLVAEGPGQNTLSYTFKEPGEYFLTYVETQTVNGKMAIVARAQAHTRVVPIPVILTDGIVDAQLELTPPPGYQKHVWRIDGQEISTDHALKFTFKDPGVHAIECLASAPNQGPAQGFLRIRYNVTVNQK